MISSRALFLELWKERKKKTVKLRFISKTSLFLVNMKTLLAILLFTLSFNSFSQDTTSLYVINNTNRLVQVGDSYSFFYRDLKYIKEIRELKFETKKELDEFFEKAYKVLNTDVALITQGYNLMRNKMNKNVLKIRNKDLGYVYIKRRTLDNMKEASNRP